MEDILGSRQEAPRVHSRENPELQPCIDIELVILLLGLVGTMLVQPHGPFIRQSLSRRGYPQTHNNSSTSVSCVCGSQACVEQNCVWITIACGSQLYVDHRCAWITIVCGSQVCVDHNCMWITVMCGSQACADHRPVQVPLAL